MIKVDRYCLGRLTFLSERYELRDDLLVSLQRLAMDVVINHCVLAEGGKPVCIEEVFYLLITLAVLTTFGDSDLEHLGVWSERPTSDVHVLFVFDTVTVSCVLFKSFIN